MVPGVTAALVLCLAACGDSDGGTSAAPTAVGTDEAPAGLDGTTFVATGVTGRELVDDTTLRVVFDDGRLGFRAGCNTQSAPYTVDGSTLRWTAPAASTMMACPPALAEQDHWLSDMFTVGAEVTVNPGGATLTDGDVTIELVLDDSGD